MRDFCESLHRGFLVTYDPATQSVSADRAIVRGDYIVNIEAPAAEGGADGARAAPGAARSY